MKLNYLTLKLKIKNMKIEVNCIPACQFSSGEIIDFCRLAQYFTKCNIKVELDKVDGVLSMELPDTAIINSEKINKEATEDAIAEEKETPVTPCCVATGYRIVQYSDTHHYLNKNLDSEINENVKVHIDIRINHFNSCCFITEFWNLLDDTIDKIQESNDIPDDADFIVTFHYDKYKRLTSNPEYIISNPFKIDEFLNWIKEGEVEEETTESIPDIFSDLFKCFPKPFWLTNRK